MAVNEDNKKSKVSIWFLYIGIFLCASGIGLVVGLIFIAYWGIKTPEESKCGNSSTENNFPANINHYHADDSVDNGDTGATVNENVPREFISKDTLEDSR